MSENDNQDIKPKLEESYAGMKAALKNMEVLLYHFQAANNNLCESWKGNGGSAFIEVSQKLYEDFTFLNRGINNIVAGLQKFQQTIIKADEHSQNIIK